MTSHTRYQPINRRTAQLLPQVQGLPEELRRDIDVVSRVLPFRANTYLLDELIDWSRVPQDPIYQLTFPQRGMLAPADYATIEALITRGASDEEVEVAARAIQRSLNPHPAGQIEMNVPAAEDGPIAGLQHKYRETVLFFPSQGQTCHAYCSYCFRWPQFVGLDDLRFAATEADALVAYLRKHPEVTSVLITGGDPMVMRTELLRRYVEPLIAADLPSLVSIRIGTKAVAYWPQRFTTDKDSSDLMRLFEEVTAAGKTLAVMAHYSHPRELSTQVAEEALRRIIRTGAIVRCQAPLIRYVNDSADAWAELWRREVKLGAVPYYMFVVRDTGARRYFEVPLARAYETYRDAISHVSGLARTVRGPSMSATPGKVTVDGIAEVAGEKVFVLRFLQARDPSWVGRPFFAKYDESVSWLSDLQPAFGAEEFFYADALSRMRTGEVPLRPWVEGGARAPVGLPIVGSTSLKTA